MLQVLKQGFEHSWIMSSYESPKYKLCLYNLIETIIKQTGIIN